MDIHDLNPKGTVFLPELAHELVQKYKFLKSPQKLEDFDEQKGVEFGAGKAGDTVIDRLTVWNSALLLITAASTTESKRILEEMLQSAKDKFGAAYAPEIVKKWLYVNSFTFYSDVDFDSAINPALHKLYDKLSQQVSEMHHFKFKYQFTGLTSDFDKSVAKTTLASFTLQRRAETAFTENKYFTEAPLSTEQHIKLIEELEAALGKA